MDQPEIAVKNPIKVELEPGTYHWCACGKSASQPFCDGSHKGGAFSPKAFTVAEKQSVWLCQCKRSSTAPFCDGSHKTL